MKRSISILLLTAALALAPSQAMAKNDDKNNGQSNGKGNGDAPAPTPTPVSTAPAVCAIGDLQAATACSGYFAGNLNGGSPDKVAAQQSALAAIGFTWDGITTIEKLENFSGQAVAFALPLIGTSFMSIHYGKGQGPGDAKGSVTGFYKVESTTLLSSLATRYGSLSNAILYSTSLRPGDGGGSIDINIGSPSAVPEPAVWLQLITGFALVGFATRHRRRAAA